MSCFAAMGCFFFGVAALASGDGGAGEAAAFWFAILGDICSFLLIVSPFPAFKIMYDNKSVGENSPFPYVMTMLNCLVWFCYSIIVESWLMKAINFFGAVVESLYVIFFLCYLGNGEVRQRRLLIALVVAGLLIAAVAAVGFALWPSTFGYAGILSGVGMYVSPLYNTYTAYQANTTEGMLSPYICLAMLANSVIWFIYALIAMDYFVMISSGAGILSAGLQLFAYYKVVDHGEPLLPPAVE